MPPVDMRFLLFTALLFVTACGGHTPAPVKHYGLQGGASSAGVHTVSNRDTLWSIAQRYNVDMKDLVYVNRLRAPYFLEIGDRLTLPPPNTYKVRAGDTLYDISRTFSISMTQLARQNSLKNPYRIHPGDTLRLPSIRPVYKANPKIQIARPGQKPNGPRVASIPVKPARKHLPIKTKTPKRASSKFAWPVSGRILSSYGPKKSGLHNDGLNIKAARGTPVKAAENGVVVYADNQLEGFGNLVLVRHEGRWMTAYAHIGQVNIKRGQTVKRGQKLGTVGSSGSVDSPQLHFEIRRGTEALNPERYLGKRGT